jgi:hypothetical protein
VWDSGSLLVLDTRGACSIHATPTNIMRVSFSGRTDVFQTSDASSILATRTNLRSAPGRKPIPEGEKSLEYRLKICAGEAPGDLATLIRWSLWVQIPPVAPKIRARSSKYYGRAASPDAGSIGKLMRSVRVRLPSRPPILGNPDKGTAWAGHAAVVMQLAQGRRF